MAEVAMQLRPSATSDFKVWSYQVSEAVGVWVIGTLATSEQHTWGAVTTAAFIDWRASLTSILGAVSFFDSVDAPVREATIEQSDLPAGEPYVLKKPIPVRMMREGELDFTANFDDAGVSIGG